MTTIEFVDTNVILRFLVQAESDEPHLQRQASLAGAFFAAVERGDRRATTCESVLVEAVQVLSSKVTYNRPRADIARRLTTLLALHSFVVPNKRTLQRALSLYADHPYLDFVDALGAAHVERLGLDEIVSFDRGFDRLPGLTRRDP